MKTSRLLTISLLVVTYSIASASLSCQGDLVEEEKCKNWKEKTCKHPTPLRMESKYCQKIKRCTCPNDDLLRYKDRCYKHFECPRKLYDGMSDSRVGHNFIIPGEVNSLNELYGMHISALKLPPHWYHAVALFKIRDADCAQAVKNGHARVIHHNLAINYRVPIKLVDLLAEGHIFNATIGTGLGPYFRPLARCEVLVDKVLDLRRYKADEPYPPKQKYFLFGDSLNAYITHIPTRCKDFQQIAWLDSVPSKFNNLKLRAGEVIYLKELGGGPALDNNGHIVDPLSKQSYRVYYDCKGGKKYQASDAMNDLEMEDEGAKLKGCKETDITIKKKYPFDTRIINIICP